MSLHFKIMFINRARVPFLGMSSIISSWKAFSEKFKASDEPKRAIALKLYFRNGGVINAVKAASGKWPKLLYPSPRRVDDQVKELEKLRQELERKEKEWGAKLSEAKSYHSRHQILKFSDPLYWKHTAKALTDKGYKEDAEKVGLPVHLVADDKWKPMVRMFMEDAEYRKNLVETVQTSIVYKDNKKVAKYADALQGFRSEISTAKLGELRRKLSGLNAQIDAMLEIKKWAGE